MSAFQNHGWYFMRLSIPGTVGMYHVHCAEGSLDTVTYLRSENHDLVRKIQS